jgi:hypothetical protein
MMILALGTLASTPRMLNPTIPWCNCIDITNMRYRKDYEYPTIEICIGYGSLWYFIYYLDELPHSRALDY